MDLRLAAPLQYDSIVDGEGMRTTLWTQGCPHNCKGCHNPGTHDFNGGYIVTTDELIDEIDHNFKFQDGITLSGGEPFMQPAALSIIASHVKGMGKSVWSYTGFTFEQLLEMSKTNKSILDLLNNVDVLVDGKFILEQKSLDLYYMGSRNQRVIDVKKSLENKKPLLIEKYNVEKTLNKKEQKRDNIFI